MINTAAAFFAQSDTNHHYDVLENYKQTKLFSKSSKYIKESTLCLLRCDKPKIVKEGSFIGSILQISSEKAFNRLSMINVLCETKGNKFLPSILNHNVILVFKKV